MSYTILKLEEDISQIITELSKMREAKGHDYSGTEDTLDNLREFGSFGVLVRIGDKFKRLKHFYDQGELKVTDEKIEDTMDDLINYTLYLKIMYQQERTRARRISGCEIVEKLGKARAGEAVEVTKKELDEINKKYYHRPTTGQSRVKE